MPAKRIVPGPKRATTINLVTVARRLGTAEKPCLLCGRNAVHESPPQLAVHVCNAGVIITTATPEGCLGQNCLGLHKVCGMCFIERVIPDTYFFALVSG